MLVAGRGRERGLLAEFQSVFSECSGFSVQAFDAKGKPCNPGPALPSLCSFLDRHRETRAACQRDCFRKAATCGNSRGVLVARCYAGLSYRLVPVRMRNGTHAVILVGRVLTEVVGAEQCAGFIERYKLPRQPFLESLSQLKPLGAPELDRAAQFLRRLAAATVGVGARLEDRRRQIERRRGLIDFARKASALSDRSPGRERGLLEYLARLLPASGVALLTPGADSGSAEVRASVGLGEDALHSFAHHDWRRTLETCGNGTLALLANRQQLLAAGLDCADSALAVRRLASGKATVGHLVVTGPALNPSDCDVLDAAADFVAAHVEHQVVRERARQRDEEARLLGLMAERCLTASSVEELLPLALEAAMRGLHARRGSILLAEEEGRIVGRALRGAHAPISATIDVIQPDSVSHRVFFNRQSLLVRDTDRELAARRERQFPYATRSFVSVPLRENGHALGVLHLTEREGSEEFTPRDLTLLERLSLQASGAICRVRLEEEVRWLRVASTTDHLTGVYNRRFFEQRLNEEIQRADRFGQPLAIAMLDVDGFKALNDELGHESGDRTLKGIAETVRHQLRGVDILARYGGDEFVLLLPGTGPDGAQRIAEKIRSRVESAELLAQPDGAARRCTVSLGLAVYPDHAAGAADLLRTADRSLFEAKRSGRNTILLRES